MAGQEGPLRVTISSHQDALLISKAWSLVGVYWFQFPDGSFYIGSTDNVRRRICGHVKMLVDGKHRNLRIQRNWARYSQIEAWPMLVCRKEDALFYEQLLMDNFDPPLNLRLIAQRPAWTKESREKISRTHSGRIVSGETCERISTSRTGQGKGNSNRKGKPSDQVELDRLSQYMMGNSYRSGTKLTQEHKDKISASLMGNKRTLGRPHTDEEKALVSEKMKRLWAAKKEQGKGWSNG